MGGGRKNLGGRYKLGRTIGHGTFGKVKEAENIRTGQMVAVKILSKETIKKFDLLRSVRSEVKALRKLPKHKHVVNLYEVLQSSDTLYLVMELVSGGELFDKIHSAGKLDEKRARVYFQQLMNGLEFMHKHKICHRDLKLENLLLDERGVLKITDFGLSGLHKESKKKKREREEREEAEDSRRHTAAATETETDSTLAIDRMLTPVPSPSPPESGFSDTGSKKSADASSSTVTVTTTASGSGSSPSASASRVELAAASGSSSEEYSSSDEDGRDGVFTTTLGSPNYVAPEVLNGRGYDGFKADIWSSGVILYALCAGFLPFDEESTTLLFQKVCTADLQYPEGFSPELIDLLDHIFEVNPTERYTIADIQVHVWFNDAKLSVGSDGKRVSKLPMFTLKKSASALSMVSASAEGELRIELLEEGDFDDTASTRSFGCGDCHLRADSGELTPVIPSGYFAPATGGSTVTGTAAGLEPAITHPKRDSLIIRVDGAIASMDGIRAEAVPEMSPSPAPFYTQPDAVPLAMTAFDLIGIVSTQMLNNVFTRSLQESHTTKTYSRFGTKAKPATILFSIHQTAFRMADCTYTMASHSYEFILVKRYPTSEVVADVTVFHTPADEYVIECRRKKGDVFKYREFFDEFRQTFKDVEVSILPSLGVGKDSPATGSRDAAAMAFGLAAASGGVVKSKSMKTMHLHKTQPSTSVSMSTSEERVSPAASSSRHSSTSSGGISPEKLLKPSLASTGRKGKRCRKHKKKGKRPRSASDMGAMSRTLTEIKEDDRSAHPLSDGEIETESALVLPPKGGSLRSLRTEDSSPGGSTESTPASAEKQTFFKGHSPQVSKSKSDSGAIISHSPCVSSASSSAEHGGADAVRESYGTEPVRSGSVVEVDDEDADADTPVPSTKKHLGIPQKEAAI